MTTIQRLTHYAAHRGITFSHGGAMADPGVDPTQYYVEANARKNRVMALGALTPQAIRAIMEAVNEAALYLGVTTL